MAVPRKAVVAVVVEDVDDEGGAGAGALHQEAEELAAQNP